MGMYDTINDEQVKCFPWVSLYDGRINYHGGDLKYYGTGDEVPYKKPHYNYGKNFIIFDLNRYPESYCCDYDYILHIIVDGKVKDTFTDNIGEIDWSVNKVVVGYAGELLNINSSDDVLNYIKAQREYWKKYEEINSHCDELFSKAMGYTTGIALLDKDSEEKKFRNKKIKEIFELIDKERERIKPELEALSKKHSKWFVNTSDIDDLINLGDYISAYNLRMDEQELCKEMIQKLLDSDDTLYDRYVELQGSDEYIKEFKSNVSC